MKSSLTDKQIEAIAIANEHTNDTGLPTYTALLDALTELSVLVLHSNDLDQNHVLRISANGANTLASRAL
jgi:hypothetical protein